VLSKIPLRSSLLR
jgi:hypothetical protein